MFILCMSDKPNIFCIWMFAKNKAKFVSYLIPCIVSSDGCGRPSATDVAITSKKGLERDRGHSLHKLFACSAYAIKKTNNGWYSTLFSPRRSNHHHEEKTSALGLAAKMLFFLFVEFYCSPKNKSFAIRLHNKNTCAVNIVGITMAVWGKALDIAA